MIFVSLHSVLHSDWNAVMPQKTLDNEQGRDYLYPSPSYTFHRIP